MSDTALGALPAGWAWGEVGTLVEDISAGKSFKCEERPPEAGEVGVVKVSAVTWGVYDELESKTCTQAGLVNRDLFIRPGDFLFSRANTIALVGACVIAGQVTRNIMLSDKILRFRVRPGWEKWLLWALRSSHGRREIERLATGNQESMRNIGQSRVRSVRIPIPSSGEQHRIVREIESHFTRLDDAAATLERVERNLKRYRASVLKAAVEGRLVPTEAALAKQEGRPYEPASVLLDRILTARSLQWSTSGMKGKYKEPVPPDTPDVTKLPVLPEGWCWATSSQIGFFQNGRAFPSGEYQDAGVRLLRPGNLHASGRVEWSAANTRHMPTGWAAEYPEYIVNGGELVMNLTAQSLKDDFLGRVCITPDGERCLLNQRIARLVPVLISPRFLLWVFKSPLFRRFVRSLNTGSLIQHMFTSQLESFVFPLPPLAEQHLISVEIERHMDIASVIERSARVNLLKSARLRQSVLKWAFEGRLTHRDADDRPTSVALERGSERRGAAGPARANRPSRGAAKKEWARRE